MYVLVRMYVCAGNEHYPYAHIRTRMMGKMYAQPKKK